MPAHFTAMPIISRRQTLLLAPAALLGVGLAGAAVYVGLRPDAAAQIGGPFALLDGAGHTVTERDFRGRLMLVYFGYTHCPDACPTALADMANAVDALGDSRNQVALIFITIDPERDTPSVMRDYVAAFEAPIIGLSGSAEAIRVAAKEYRVFYAKHPTEAGYDMDHSSIIYAMDRAGQFAAVFTHESPPEQITAELRRLLAA